MIPLLMHAGHFDWSVAISSIALIVSIVSIYLTNHASSNNLGLSARQAVINSIGQKAKDCNSMWDALPETTDKKTLPRNDLVNELVITIQVIKSTIEILGANDDTIGNSESKYYGLLYNQLRPHMRDWFKKISKAAIAAPDPKGTYDQQVTDVYAKLHTHFE